MADISETLLQVAQVVNQSYGMLAKAQNDAAELEVRRKNYEDMAKSREEALGYKEQAIQEKSKADALIAADRTRRLDQRDQELAIKEDLAGVAQGRLELGQYKADQDKLYKENKFSKSEYDALIERLDRSLIGMNTGQPDLDKGPLIQMRTKQLQDQLPVLLRAQATGDLASLGPEFKIAIAASNPGLLDQDKAAALAAQVRRVLGFRTEKASKIVEGYPERERNIILGTDFRKSALQSVDTSVQKQSGDQANANAGVGQKAMAPAAPGTTSPMGPPDPAIAAAQDVIDRTPASELAPATRGQTAVNWERAAYDLLQAGKKKEGMALLEKMNQRSPETLKEVMRLFDLRGKK